LQHLLLLLLLPPLLLPPLLPAGRHNTLRCQPHAPHHLPTT
jgi:hypothetical protein